MPGQSKKRRWTAVLAGALEEQYRLEPSGSAPERGPLWDLTHGGWGVSLKLPQLRADAGK